MRHEQEFDADNRSSALWGKGGRGERRSSALWGKGGRGLIAMTIAAAALAFPLAAGADDDKGEGKGRTYIAPGVFQAAGKGDKVRVIIQSTAGVADAEDAAKRNGEGAVLKKLERTGVVVAELPAGRIHSLAKREGLIVTLDAPILKAEYSSSQLWPYQSGVHRLWGTTLYPAPAAPAIAVVDSGIHRSDSNFGNRIVARQVLTDLQPNTQYDGRGHGTFVAGIAAGEAPDYAGASPTSDLVDLDVMDDRGMARTSDVIAACEWILKNKHSRNIRVANFSLHSSSVLSIKYHPLNRAVEKLWFSGVVVVAAAGNYGIAGGPSGVKHAPGNDPFVITVGAFDLNGSTYRSYHDVPDWSAWGYSNEGFAKPDVVAAGRYLVGPVSPTATLAQEKPDRVVARDYMRLSGTSFSAPVVSGVAAQILARHPRWTPDQVKGALMQTARRIPDAPRLQQGRGEVNGPKASFTVLPPNPNASLNRFLVPDPNGDSLPVWDASAWYDAMRTDSGWDSSGWQDSAWQDSAWADSAWADSGWADSAWNDSAWNDSAWNDSAWADSSSYEDNVEGEPDGSTYQLTPSAEREVENDPDLAVPGE